MAASTLKQFPIPPDELRSRPQICFRHPGYPAPNNLLLSLPRVDRTPTGTFGVCHRTALLACQIIAANAFDGRLTLDQLGQQLVDTDQDILSEHHYFFMVDNGPTRYPIVPSFKDWEFPHDRLPDPWSHSSWSRSPISGRRCAVTNFAYPLEQAHLVPKEETKWYNRNDMARYATDALADINDPANVLSLTSHIHKIFDHRDFVIVPKVAENETRFVTHILLMSAAEFWPTHHNASVNYLDRGSGPFLLARFAWAVIFHVKQFILGQSGRLVRVQEREVEDTVETVTYKTELFPAKKLQDLYGGGGSKAASPKGKRSRTGSGMDEASGVDEDSGESSDEDQDKDDTWDMMDQKWEVGGENKRRRRQQSSSEETASDDTPFLATDVERELRETLQKGVLGLGDICEETEDMEMVLPLR